MTGTSKKVPDPPRGGGGAPVTNAKNHPLIPPHCQQWWYLCVVNSGYIASKKFTRHLPTLASYW